MIYKIKNPNSLRKKRKTHPKSPERAIYFRIAGGAAIFASGYLSDKIPWLQVALFMIAYVILGYDVIFRATANIFKKRFFDENTLMSIATIGAIAIAAYPEAAAVMLFYKIGEILERNAIGKTRSAVKSLMKIKPTFANVKTPSGCKSTRPEKVRTGSEIIIKPGERVPIDCSVSGGSSSLDTSAITGESIPRYVVPGDVILSGFMNLDGLLQATTLRSYSDSTVSRILDMVENASARKTKTENFITKFAAWYTPAVVACAFILALLPPLITGSLDFQPWIYRALVFLVVSCPCALVLSIPLGYSVGIGTAARHGILIKGSNYLEVLNRVGTVAFDKTGTLTRGKFSVVKTSPAPGFTESALLHYAAHAEYYSIHPIAKSILEAYPEILSAESIDNHTVVPGLGVKAYVGGEEVLAGSAAFISGNNISMPVFNDEITGTVVHLAVNGRYYGYIIVSDTLKPDAAETISKLKLNGIRTVLLTGDNERTAMDIACRLGIDETYFGLLPQQKAEILENIRAEKNDKSSKRAGVAFAGDGINDAPVLKLADIGIAMGRSGSDVAVECADIALLSDEPMKIVEAMSIARRTRHIIVQNIIGVLAFKIVVLALGALGIATMWTAVFADVGVAVAAILNSLRILKIK